MSDQAFSAQLFEVDRVANSHSDIELHRSRVLLAYSEGLVLFSRERLQSLKLQIEEYRRTRAAGFVIHVNDLEGNHADLPVLSGHVSSPVDGNFDLERVLGDPLIEYQPIQELINSPSIGNDQSRTALPLRIKYRKFIWNIVTKQPVLTALAAQTPLSVADLSHALEARRREFHDSGHWDHLMRLFELKQHSLSRVEKIVAFACGSMAKGLGTDPSRSLTQHVLVLALRDLLATLRSERRPIPCFVQDPTYTAEDQQLLASQAVAVHEDPDGFLEVDETTLIVSFCASAPVKQIIADLVRPAAMIWDNLGEGSMTDPWSPRVEAMVSTGYNASSLMWHQDYNYATLLLRNLRHSDKAQDGRDHRRGNSTPDQHHGQAPGSSATAA